MKAEELVERQATVKVIHGANNGLFNIEGITVATLQASLSDAFNIPKEVLAFVNGEQVDPAYRLQPHDTVEYLKQYGEKSILDPDEKAQLDRIETMLTRLFGKPADHESDVSDNGIVPTASTTSGVLAFGPIQVNKTESEATVYGKTYPLDIVQLEVLACLVASKGHWITRSDMKKCSRILKDEEHLERLIKSLKKTVQSLSPLIVSSSRGYKLLLPGKVG